MTRQAIVKSPAARPRRNRINVRNRLTVANKEPGYMYRVVNDVEDRVEILKEIGYEIVNAGDVKVGEARVDVGSNVGSAASMSVGNGVRGVVMRIREDWYNEDQANKQADIEQTESAMKKQDGLIGEVQITRGNAS